jgi:hypothetical protein
MIITGYKYTTEQEAQSAVQACNTHYGIPVSPEATTRTWVEYQTASLDEPVFYYIRWNNTLNVVLGEPSEFEVTLEPIITEHTEQ